MLETFGERQQLLLRALHAHKSGLTIDELASRLSITRTAVKQHLVALEQGGYVDRGPLRVVTRGRPGRGFRLTERGVELFPKQYSWFSSLLLGGLRAEFGSEGLANRLREIARGIVSQMKTRVHGSSGQGRTEAIVTIMNELSYEAVVSADPTGEIPSIEAHNCVYHNLAREYPEVCQFDIELLEKFSGLKVDHQECIIRGGNVCRFAFRKCDKE
ncbi:helix-turn-helix transcriptional regulator [Oligoflexus tunisiensis]|uniref:helix-turn-helix transcriptional regulator n=1 Tax=Oligoflexus tunisiensis TaxID=708132 RepID=UPI00114D1342|nr:HTH domain-containing protein [Oligoflexus tunisiensis]